MQIVANALGKSSFDELTPIQKSYADKIALRLETNAKRLKGELTTATRMYDSGVLAYSKGLYDDASLWMSAALQETSPTSLLGGRVQMYMALACDACGRRDHVRVFHLYILT